MSDRKRWKIALIVAALFACFCKILLAWNTFGTNDVYTWERFSFWSRLLGVGVYRVNTHFNHPPSMIHALRFLGWLTDVTGIPFHFWMRIPAVIADLGSLLILWRLFGPRLDQPAVRWTMLFTALSPVLILISGFHGNSDPEMIFFVLLSVWLIEKGTYNWGAGAALGAALCIKILPVIVVPAMFFYRPDSRRRIVLLSSLTAVVLLAWSPYIFEAPRLISHRVFSYQSQYSSWGLMWLLSLVSGWHSVSLAFRNFGSYFVIILIAALSFWVNRPTTKPSLYLQVGAILFLFLGAASGFGAQYLAWLAPWTIGLGIYPAVAFFTAGGTFLFLTYDHWAGGVPWYLSDANYPRINQPQLEYTEVVCWLSVVLLAWSAWRKISRKRDSSAGAIPCLILVCVLAFVVVQRRATTGESLKVTTMSAAEYVDLGMRLDSVGKLSGKLGPADRVLAMHPGLARATIDVPDFALSGLWQSLSEGYAERGERNQSAWATHKAHAVAFPGR